MHAGHLGSLVWRRRGGAKGLDVCVLTLPASQDSMNILDPEDEEEHTQEDDSSGSNEDEDDSQDEEEEEEEDEDDQVCLDAGVLPGSMGWEPGHLGSAWEGILGAQMPGFPAKPWGVLGVWMPSSLTLLLSPGPCRTMRRGRRGRRRRMMMMDQRWSWMRTTPISVPPRSCASNALTAMMTLSLSLTACSPVLVCPGAGFPGVGAGRWLAGCKGPLAGEWGDLRCLCP